MVYNNGKTDVKYRFEPFRQFVGSDPINVENNIGIQVKITINFGGWILVNTTGSD